MYTESLWFLLLFEHVHNQSPQLLEYLLFDIGISNSLDAVKRLYHMQVRFCFSAVCGANQFSSSRDI